MDVLINRIYKHFKGDYYIVLGVGTSLVDKNKYPNVKQKYKFELQNIESKRNK